MGYSSLPLGVQRHIVTTWHPDLPPSPFWRTCGAAVDPEACVGLWPEAVGTEATQD